MLKNVLRALAAADDGLRNELWEWPQGWSQQGGEFHMTPSAVGLNRIEGSRTGEVYELMEENKLVVRFVLIL